MATLLIHNARVLTLAGPRPRRGPAMRDLGVIDRCDVLVDDATIVEVRPGIVPPAGARVIDARGRVVMPGFVDCHTHMCWAGSRIDEWEKKLAGATYLDILKSGGGIMSTVRSVRAASEDELVRLTSERVERALRQGTTTIEIKSGYGLTTADELKMLRAVERTRYATPASLVATALLGHAIAPDVPRDDFVRATIEETLPAVGAEFPRSIAVDAFCESGAWTLDECVRLFEAARAAGHPIRVHADQFTSMGMVAKAVELGALSVDHLEATTPEDAALLGRSSTFGVILPLCGLHVDDRYANARRLVDAGVALCVASNANPGSAPSTSVALAASLAVRKCGLTPAEAITAITVNPAALLGLDDRGSIEPGKRADLVMLRHTDERSLVYELESDHAHLVVAGGTPIDDGHDIGQPR